MPSGQTVDKYNAMRNNSSYGGGRRRGIIMLLSHAFAHPIRRVCVCVSAIASHAHATAVPSQVWKQFVNKCIHTLQTHKSPVIAF